MTRSWRLQNSRLSIVLLSGGDAKNCQLMQIADAIGMMAHRLRSRVLCGRSREILGAHKKLCAHWNFANCTRPTMIEFSFVCFIFFRNHFPCPEWLMRFTANCGDFSLSQAHIHWNSILLRAFVSKFGYRLLPCEEISLLTILLSQMPFKFADRKHITDNRQTQWM